MVGPAEAILSTIGAKSAAWQTKQAAVERSNAHRMKSMEDIAETLGNFPTLMRQGKEERERAAVQEAAASGFMERGWDGMLEAGLSVPTTTPGGEAAKFDLTFKVTGAKDRAQIKALEQAKFDLDKRQTNQAIKAQQEALALQTGRRSGFQAAMAPSPAFTPASPFAIPGAAPHGTPMVRPTMEQGLENFVGGSEFATPEDAFALQEMKQKAKLAMDSDLRIRSLAEKANENRLEIQDKKFQIALLESATRTLGYEKAADTAEKKLASNERIAAGTNARIAETNKIHSDRLEFDMRRTFEAARQEDAQEARLAISDLANRAGMHLDQLQDQLHDILKERNYPSDEDRDAEAARVRQEIALTKGTYDKAQVSLQAAAAEAEKKSQQKGRGTEQKIEDISTEELMKIATGEK